MGKHNMNWLRKKKEKELEELYIEYNMIISRVKGQIKLGALEGDAKLKTYNEAVKNRARILTILNQRRNERMHRNGGTHGIKLR